MSSGQDPVESLLGFAAGHVRAKRRAALGRAMARAVSCFAAAVVVAAMVDRFVPLPEGVRTGLLVAVAVMGGLMLVHPVYLWLRGATVVEAATELERDASLRRESLVTLAWQHYQPSPGASSELIGLLAERTGREVARYRESGGGRESVRGHWIAAIAVVLGGVLLTSVPGLRLAEALPRVLTPWGGREPLVGPRLRVQPGEASLRQGGELRILASLEDSRGSSYGYSTVTAFVETTRDGENFSQTEMSRRDAAGFTLELPPVDRPLSYRVRMVIRAAATERELVSQLYDVDVTTTPAATRITLDVVEPSAVNTAGRIQSVAVNSADAIPVRAGSDITLKLETTEPLVRGELAGPGFSLKFLPDASASPASGGGGSTATIRLPESVTQLASCQLVVSFQNERGATGRAVVNLTAIPDAPPVVRIEQPGNGFAAGPRDDIDVVVTATDDLGVGSMWLEVVVPSRDTFRFDLPVAEPGRSVRSAYRVNLASLPLSADERVVLTAVARDTARHEARSAPVSLQLSSSVPEPLSYSRAVSLRGAINSLESVSSDLAKAKGLLGGDRQADAVDLARAHLSAAVDGVGGVRQAVRNLARLTTSPEQGDACEAIAQRLVKPAILLDSLVGSELSSEAGRAGVDPPAALDGVQADLSEVASVLESWLRGEEASQQLGSGQATEAQEEAVRAATRRLRELKGVDAVAPLKGFAEVSPAVLREVGLRLEAAWEIEAVRPDSVPVRAADLALLGGAAEKVRETGVSLAELAGLFEPLGRVHGLLRAHEAVPGDLRAEAERARGRLGELSAPLPRAAQALREAAQLLDSGRGQAGGPATLPAGADLSAMASMQRELAGLIVRAGTPELQALLSRQQAVMDRLMQSRAETSGNRIAAFRAASEAQRTLDRLQEELAVLGGNGSQDAERVRRAREYVARFKPEALIEELRRYVPELASTARLVEARVKPLLTAFNAKAGTGEQAGLRELDLAMTSARESLDAARRAMRARDPLAAAQASLASVTASLGQSDPQAAASMAREAAEALELAAQQARRPYLQARLAFIPQLFAATDASVGSGGASGSDSATTGTGGGGVPVEFDEATVPAEYRAAVRAYFGRLRVPAGASK